MLLNLVIELNDKPPWRREKQGLLATEQSTTHVFEVKRLRVVVEEVGSISGCPEAARLSGSGLVFIGLSISLFALIN